ncbi:hypothetical protein A2U01_0079736 [Trifolium medium]|uniref:Uncharacterized protein n=1 Tax=Trifolium medium TaxID=97028 RepID=A0A392TBI1_9FABA|nr:hypothetical protein [Trifolium medium]
MSREFIEFVLAQRASLLCHAPSRTDESAQRATTICAMRHKPRLSTAESSTTAQRAVPPGATRH